MKRITLATTVLTVGLFAGSLAGVNPALADEGDVYQEWTGDISVNLNTSKLNWNPKILYSFGDQVDNAQCPGGWGDNQTSYQGSKQICRFDSTSTSSNRTVTITIPPSEATLTNGMKIAMPQASTTAKATSTPVGTVVGEDGVSLNVSFLGLNTPSDMSPYSVTLMLLAGSGSYEFNISADTQAVNDLITSTLNASGGVGNAVDTQTEPTTPTIRMRSTDSDLRVVAKHQTRVEKMATKMHRQGGILNVHAYGPNEELALERASVVVDALKAHLTKRGDTGEAPIYVTYAGDPDHKKNVHVTIHWHPNTTVSEGETLTIGETKHTKAQAWIKKHLDSKNSPLTNMQRETVSAHLVASSTPEQVQSTWDIDMNEDVSIVDAAKITQIARYFLDHPTEHILVRDHVGAGVHGSTVVDAVLAEMARLATDDGTVKTRGGFLDWLNQVVVSINDFTNDLNAAEVEIHAVTVALDDAALSIANLITDGTTLVGDVIKDVETVINPILTAVDEGTVVAKTVKDVIAVLVAL